MLTLLAALSPARAWDIDKYGTFGAVEIEVYDEAGGSYGFSAGQDARMDSLFTTYTAISCEVTETSGGAKADCALSQLTTWGNGDEERHVASCAAAFDFEAGTSLYSCNPGGGLLGWTSQRSIIAILIGLYHGVGGRTAAADWDYHQACTRMAVEGEEDERCEPEAAYLSDTRIGLRFAKR